MSETTTIEINGIKMEVDLRHAKRIDTFRVGDKVKILTKEYSAHKVYPGVIVGFENFKKLPTIIIAYMKIDYSEATLEFAYLNTESEDLDMVITDDDYLPVEKAEVIEKFDREILKKEAELEDMKRKKAYFQKHFQMYFKVPTNDEGVKNVNS